MLTRHLKFLLVAILVAASVIIVFLTIIFKEILTIEIVWIAWGVLIAAGSVIGTIVFDIYDRHKQNKTQILELVRSYGEQLANLSDKEPKLNNKKDCENYAIEYLDLMDQIAYLYMEDSIPPSVAIYFDNNFSYAKTLLIWLNHTWYEIPTDDKKIEVNVKMNLDEKDKNKKNKKVLDAKDIDKMNLYEVDENKEKKKIPVAKDLITTWEHLYKWWEKMEIVPFDPEELPEAMQRYDSLPSEDITIFLEVVRGYGKQLTELMDKERTLKTRLDCELYAMSYLDLMDQIAFLYKKKSIPEDVAEYFDNYFSYAKALLIWIQDKTGILIDEKRSKIEIRLYDDKKTIIPQEIRDEWIDLVTWCENRKIDASDIEQLPETMQKYRVKH